jgi:CubicO group peptidase (beta-lactamase class C family)
VTPIHGTTDPRFRSVRDAFAANFRDHGEVGAALCVYHRGHRVVDLWGGIADLTTGTPWAEDTLQYVFSTTKGFTATCAHLLVQRGELDLHAPVADYWPEFAATGKHHIPVRWLLSHRDFFALVHEIFGKPPISLHRYVYLITLDRASGKCRKPRRADGAALIII